jgi:hypothetical protein
MAGTNAKDIVDRTNRRSHGKISNYKIKRSTDFHVNYKDYYIKRQLFHMRHVQDNMFLLESNLKRLPLDIGDFELIGRSLYHDTDKLAGEDVDGFFESFKHKFNVKHNLSNEGVNMSKIEKARKGHLETKRHHLEYHKVNNIPISDVDICEMASDIYAVKQEREEPFKRALEHTEGLIKEFSLTKE